MRRLLVSLTTLTQSRGEAVSTVLMGLAAVITAWCAFEGAIWSGIQAVQFASTSAARVESTRLQLLDNQLAQVDVATFLAWIEALQEERGSRLSEMQGPYRPDPDTVSGFLYQRFRPEFREAIAAWVATRPAVDEAAPPTPFAMKEYRRPLNARALLLLEAAEQKAQAGQEANRHSDHYMLVTVISSMVIFFAGMSTKLALPSSGAAMLLLACIALFACAIAIFSLPVTFS